MILLMRRIIGLRRLSMRLKFQLGGFIFPKFFFILLLEADDHLDLLIENGNRAHLSF